MFCRGWSGFTAWSTTQRTHTTSKTFVPIKRFRGKGWIKETNVEILFIATFRLPSRFVKENHLYQLVNLKWDCSNCSSNYVFAAEQLFLQPSLLWANMFQPLPPSSWQIALKIRPSNYTALRESNKDSFIFHLKLFPIHRTGEKYLRSSL